MLLSIYSLGIAPCMKLFIPSLFVFFSLFFKTNFIPAKLFLLLSTYAHFIDSTFRAVHNTLDNERFIFFSCAWDNMSSSIQFDSYSDHSWTEDHIKKNPYFSCILCATSNFVWRDKICIHSPTISKSKKKNNKLFK